MFEPHNPTFNVASFLANAGLGRRIVQILPKRAFFLQGDVADSVFYLQKGRARITVVSQAGKEATSSVRGLAFTASVSDWTNERFASNEPDGSPSTL